MFCNMYRAFYSLICLFAIYRQCRINLFSLRQQMAQHYRLRAGRLLMASSFNLSTARVYFSVCFNPLCPNRLATVLILAPLFRMFTAKLWRAQCQLMCFVIPARFTHRFTDLQQLSYEGRLNMEEFKSSGALPINESNPLFRRIITPLCAECPFVFFFSKFSVFLQAITKHTLF